MRSGRRGAGELRALWRDPDIDPDLPAIIEERAWSSPIRLRS